MKKYIILSILFFITFVIPISAQEYVIGLNVNAKVQEQSCKKTNLHNNKSITNSLELPFFDDFSDSKIYPKTSLWGNNYVYINSTLAPEPPSIGVATFDAVNEKGEIYPHAFYNEPFVADTLTSLPINLNYPADNSMFLSFYYRPGGIGNAPEVQDSLILEFFAPEENVWYSAWIKEGSEDKDFEFVIISINEDKFLKDGFKFRFKNIASFGSSIYPALATNCDFWHIDYVYLNRGRNENDNVFHDIAFTKPLYSLLKNYEAIPWAHFKNMSNPQIKETLSVEFYNNDNVNTRIIDSLNFTLTDLSGNSEKQKYFGGTFSYLNPLTIFPSDFTNHTFNFPTNNDDTCDFNFQAKIVTEDADYKKNNTVSYTQKFKNYYAYDDGSAEAGYGIYGTGTKYVSVAYKFEPVANGNLKGVNIYFTQAYNNESQNYFWLNVWNEAQGGVPDTVMVSLEGQKPEYEDEINKFYYYEFDEAVPVDNNFFIGWTQTTDEMLNVGFDYNNIANDKVFYNIGGTWIKSAILGAIMIRPVFENSTFKTINKSTESVATVSPSITSTNINIEFNYNSNKIYNLKIYNIHGVLVYNDNNYQNKKVEVKNFQKGMHFVRIINNSKTILGRFIVK